MYAIPFPKDICENAPATLPESRAGSTETIQRARTLRMPSCVIPAKAVRLQTEPYRIPVSGNQHPPLTATIPQADCRRD
ncbi:hypothetical protein [Planctomicrobium piriforme]|uniref:Uncharacterized protein n=1 Tax=Planctomicrobium piriforme TaxID=1576369 RepID=A0A1I3GLZ1_9PLAN|nr:hypothetical protein [Planctomicrobium piriforme]SFI24282.1 hypothetical protein SAMN05421753_10743 [Planctomicrobium piriforme]